MKSDARDADGGVYNVECCAWGSQAAAAVEDGGRRHPADDEKCNVADADRGLVKGARSQEYEGSAALNSVSDGFARQRRVAAARGRVVAGRGVDSR